MTPPQPVHQVARKRMLARRTDGRFALLGADEACRPKLEFIAVRPAQHAATGGVEVARPANVSIGMAEVALAAGVEKAYQPRSDAGAVAPNDPQLEDVADAIATPYGPDQRVDHSQDAILQPKRCAPKWRHHQLMRRGGPDG